MYRVLQDFVFVVDCQHECNATDRLSLGTNHYPRRHRQSKRAWLTRTVVRYFRPCTILFQVCLGGQ